MSFAGVDWTKAPPDATHWEMTEFGVAVWAREVDVWIGENRAAKGLVSCNGDKTFAPDFGYVGDWRDSATDRVAVEAR